MKQLIITALVLMLSACASKNSVEPVNVMVLVQDDGEDSLPSSHRAVSRFIRAVSGDLSDNGVNVYDAATEFSYSGSRSKMMLLDMARSYSRANIDYVIILTADASVSRSGYTTRMMSVVNGQTIAVGSGRVNGSFTVDGSTQNADSDCDRFCINEGVGDSLLSVSGEVSERILATLPSAYSSRKPPRKPMPQSSSEGPPVTDFNLVFDGFNNQEMAEIEDYLTIFSGYDTYRYASKSRAHAEIMYRAAISRNKLNQNLNRVLSEMRVDGVVRITGNNATITKSQTRQSRKDDLNSWEE